jgi:hypothetical protein
MMWHLIALVGSVLSVVLVIHGIMMFYVAKQAKTRGYSFWQWMIAGFLSHSLVFVVMLGLMPDRSLESRRLEKKKLLQGKLRSRRITNGNAITVGAILNTSIGDMATMDLERMGMQQSIGDQATAMPASEQLNTSFSDASTRVRPFNQSIADQDTKLN